MTTPAGNETQKLSFDSFGHIIDGKPRSSSTRLGLNRANCEAKAEVPVATEQDLGNTIAAAKATVKK
jgi:hypothetical protein